VPFVVDDLLAWLVGLLADEGRKKMTTWIFGDEQTRARPPQKLCGSPLPSCAQTTRSTRKNWR